MLDKVVIHLKNILFFKATVYLLLVGALFFVVIPVFTEDLVKSSRHKEKSYLSLNQATQKLNSIKLFENEIPATAKKYQQLIENSKYSKCFDRNQLLESLKPLEKEYNLPDSIELKISRLFDEKSTIAYNNQVKIKGYEAIITFQANNQQDIVKINHDICQLLPQGSTLKKVEIKKIEVLTPETIAKLSTKNFPGLYKVALQAHLREIVYED